MTPPDISHDWWADSFMLLVLVLGLVGAAVYSRFRR